MVEERERLLEDCSLSACSSLVRILPARRLGQGAALGRPRCGAQRYLDGAKHRQIGNPSNRRGLRVGMVAPSNGSRTVVGRGCRSTRYGATETKTETTRFKPPLEDQGMAWWEYVRRQGLEPRTRGLRVRCSAN